MTPVNACQSMYQQKRSSAAKAVRLVRNGDFIVVPTGVGEPPTLLAALSAQRGLDAISRLQAQAPCGKVREGT